MKKTVLILFTSVICLCVGTAVAYYNTSSFGYDNANIITVRDDSVQILDINIKYEDVKKTYEYIKEKTPDNFITISCKKL